MPDVLTSLGLERSVRPRLSIAMCTFNGARFLPEQLASIEGQDRQPDELVVCDDGSTDATVSLLQAFASSATFPVRVLVNETNLGAVKNFEHAISLCAGDLIALCDQDDVWHSNKLAKSEAALLGSDDVGLVFSDAEVASQALDPLHYRISSPAGLDASAKRKIARGRAVEVLARANVATGATMVFRSRFRGLLLPIPSDGERIHDGWIALLIASVARVVYLDEPLMLYRQHEKQQVGLRAAGLRRLSIRGHHWVPQLTDEEAEETQRASIISLLAAAEALERRSASAGYAAAGLAQILIQAAYMLRYDDPQRAARLRARALALDSSIKPLGEWKYNLAQSLLGAHTATRLIEIKRYMRRWREI